MKVLLSTIVAQFSVLIYRVIRVPGSGPRAIQAGYRKGTAVEDLRGQASPKVAQPGFTLSITPSNIVTKNNFICVFCTTPEAGEIGTLMR
jgi:hypothetical protein